MERPRTRRQWACWFSGLVRGPAAADYVTDCQNPTAVYPDASGMPTNLNLSSTDVVEFASGTFTGSVNNNLGTICVAAGAQFNPTNINGASRVFVRGAALLPALAAGSGALLDNEGSVHFLAQPNTNGVATVINRVGATILIDAGLALGQGVTVTNDGTINVQGGVNLNGSAVTSNGTLTIAGPLNIVGAFTNTADATVVGVVTVNGGGSLQNSCRLTAAGLINNQTTGNSGVVQLGQGELRNNGAAVYSQTTSGFTGGTNFGNDGTVDGSGQYLFSGTTSTQGTVAGGAATPIVFDDTSPTGGQIFDTQLGTITNTVQAPVTAPDPSSCTATPPTTTTSTTPTTTTTTVPTTNTSPTSTTPTSVASGSTTASTSDATVGPAITGSLPGTGARGAEPTYVAGLLLIVIGCLAYAIGRGMPDTR